MSTIRTNLSGTREAARQIRFEPVGPITSTDVQGAIRQLSSTPLAISGTTVAVTPYNVLPTDTVLYVDTSIGAVQINLGPQVARNGVPLEILDVTGNAAANNISIVRSGAETIDGLTTLPVNTNFGGWKLYPKAGGWKVAA